MHYNQRAALAVLVVVRLVIEPAIEEGVAVSQV
jgi:hypothetical protein